MIFCELLIGNTYVRQLHFKIVRRGIELWIGFFHFEAANPIAAPDLELVVELIRRVTECHEADIAARIFHHQREHFSLIIAFAPSANRAFRGDASTDSSSAAIHRQISNRLERAMGFFFGLGWTFLLDWLVEHI